jgi:hypothetical protein
MKFKSKLVEERFSYLHPKLKEIVVEMAQWLGSHYGINLVVTCSASTLSEDQDEGREHAGHRERRACDIRANDWEPAVVLAFETQFENKFRDFAATGVKTGRKNLVEFHGEGANYHAHIQLSMVYALPPIEEPHE